MATSNKDSKTVDALNNPLSSNTAQISLESNLNYLLLKTLKFICHRMGLLKTGQKQEIVFRVLKEKRRQTSLKVLINKIKLFDNRTQHTVIKEEKEADAYTKYSIAGQRLMLGFM
ncbi:7474_t:CDS:2 [Cetraspora pellucida]|uniref:7474_t:CDS:1 n=1 Tax=Cetraspora pellucida TaxID=1433469 RepID=A0A9N9IFJ8_9GLOM|nr:7474_t:CDS:2 [Cetraspora pellucida]